MIKYLIFLFILPLINRTLSLFFRYRIFDKASSQRRWQDDNPLLGSVRVETVETTDFEDTTKNERGPGN